MTGAVGLLAAAVLGLVALVAGYHTFRSCWIYAGIAAAVLGGPAPAPPRFRTTDGREPAYELYCFGPARSDLRQMLTRTRTDLESEFRLSSAVIWQQWWAPGPTRRAIGLLRIYALVVGTAIAVVLVAAVTAVQVVVVVVVALAGLIAVILLRTVDAALLWVRRIRMTCPGCYRRIGYPAYRCPGCGAWHRDVRPGRYGLLRRRCSCGDQTLPTLLLLGSHRLTAFCPYPDCEVQLADASGTATEVLLPIVGGQNVGKTRLLTVIVKVMRDTATRDGVGLEFADRTTSRRIARLAPAVLAGEATRPTPPEQPRAYSLYLSPRKARSQLIHLFDTAGEKFYESEVLEHLSYLGPSRTFLFVIDPLSIDRIWAGIDPRTQDRLTAVRARRSPEYVFQQVLDNVERMSVDPKRARLAVAVTKADLLRSAGISAPSPGSDAVRQWLDDAGLDNLVRTIRHAFGEVRFFHTSAMLTPDGSAQGVPELVEWLLAAPPTPRRTTPRRAAQR